jgi:RimJ/RimL family protein N-acetyltransferase
MNLQFETERLILRKLTSDDADYIYRLDSDPEVMKYIGKLRNREEAKKAAKNIEKYNRKHSKYGLWAAVEKSSNKFVGWICLKHLGDTEEIEVGYRLLKKFWGKGYATEGSKALVKYGFEILELPKITAIVEPNNNASVNVIKKLGLKYIKKANFYNTDVDYFQMKYADYFTDIIVEPFNAKDELEWLDVHASVMVDSDAWWTVLHKKPKYVKSTELVAKANSKIIGFIDIEINSEVDPGNHPSGFVWEFGVHRYFRGKGIGKKLIEAAHKAMNEKFNINKSVWYSQDEFAKNYYSKMGMKEIGRHYQYSIKPDKEDFQALLAKGFNCWNMRGSCDIKDWGKVNENFKIMKDVDALNPRICIGFEYVL